MQQFSFNPDRDIFIESYFENVQRQKKKIRKPSVLSLNPLFIKEW